MSELDREGPLAPPRRNGELAFAAVWESRVFGLTMSLYEAGAFEWNEFRDRLIAEIAAGGSHYWTCWLAAFERLITDKGLCPASALSERVALLAARPHGHDHHD